MTIFSKIKNLIPLFLLIFHVYLLYIPELKGNYVWHHILLFGIELTIPLYLYFGKTSSQNYVSKRTVVLLAGIFVFIQISTLHTAKRVLKQFPEHVSLSDVVPQVDTMATRFLNHQYPYHPIVFGEATSQWTMHPTYMPMQWLPYCLPVYFHLDIRWFALLLFCLSIGIVFWKLRNQITLNTTLLFLCLPLLLYLIVWNKEAVKTVESGIVALYILIPVFIWKKQYLLTGILITLCLLSRFTIIYWVPFYLLAQNPAAFGIDIVLHSGSKYLNGHSDVVAGVLCASSEMVQKIFSSELMTIGAALAPHDAALIIRGLRTLPLRLQRSSESAQAIVTRLGQHPKVERIWYPFHDSFPQRELAMRQMRGCSGLFSVQFRADSMEKMEAFIHRLRRFLMAVSWGGHESLMIPMVGFYNIPGRPDPDLPWNFVRFYIGLEDAEWLWEDLEQAMEVL